MLGVWDAGALIVGIIIGSGIFATPPIVAGHLPHPITMLGIWVLGGLLALCGALCFAELAAMFPYTGGSYAFLREGYGPLPAFAYGWCALLVTYPASIAAVSIVFVAYFARLVPVAEGLRPYLAAFVCLLFTGLNILGVRLGAWTLRVLTGSKVLALGGLAIAAFLSGAGSWSHLAGPAGTSPAGFGVGVAALALAAVLWTFEGWSDGPTLSGEVRNPNRDVVAALVAGTAIVTLVYVVTNLAYIYVLGMEGVRDTDSVAVDVAAAVFRRGGDTFVTLLVVVSTLGSIMGMIIGGSRVLFAMGRDRLFFEWAGRVHARGTPAPALALLGILSALYAALGTFEGIIGYFVFVSTIFLTMNVVSVTIHRIRRPGHPRPFRAPLHPLPPLVYSLVALTLLTQLLRENTRNALIGLAVVAASVPVYGVWIRIKRRTDAAGRVL